MSADFTTETLTTEQDLLNLIQKRFDANEDYSTININSDQAISLRSVLTRRINISSEGPVAPTLTYSSPFGDHEIRIVPGAN